MKKLILSIVGLVVTAASTTSTISCIHASYTQGEVGERIVMGVAAGRVFDKSFNQEAFEAVLDYSNREEKVIENEILQGGFNFNKRGLSANKNYVEPLKPDASELISSYKVSVVKGTDILVLTGFQHSATVDVAADLLGPNKTVIFVDSSVGTRSNIINLVYNSQLAGFAAGYDAAVWATTKGQDGKMLGDIQNSGFISFGTYGGVSSKFAVDSYMWGFMVAIRYFNMRMEHDSNPEERQRHVYFANAGFKKDVQDAKNITGTNTRYFTGSFDASGSNKVGMNQLLFNEGKASVIFPVAGVQIADTLAFTEKVYVIGVDTDQSKQYPSYESRFVTSALKNLKKSISDAIDHSKANRLNRNLDGSLMVKPITGDDYWDGKQAPAQLDWSVDVDQTTNDKGSKIPKTLIDYKDVKFAGLINDLVDFYNHKAGERVESYMSPDKITKMAQIIYEKYNDLIATKFLELA